MGEFYEPGKTTTRMYLPSKGSTDEGYVSPNAPYQNSKAGQWTEIESEWRKSISETGPFRDAKSGRAVRLTMHEDVGDEEPLACLPAKPTIVKAHQMLSVIVQSSFRSQGVFNRLGLLDIM